MVFLVTTTQRPVEAQSTSLISCPYSDENKELDSSDQVEPFHFRATDAAGVSVDMPTAMQN
jgi:hypothetical protein